MFIFIIVEFPQGLLAVLSTVTDLQLIVALGELLRLQSQDDLLKWRGAKLKVYCSPKFGLELVAIPGSEHTRTHVRDAKLGRFFAASWWFHSLKSINYSWRCLKPVLFILKLFQRQNEGLKRRLTVCLLRLERGIVYFVMLSVENWR